jgi:RimJ/RimL family protein N-acetyltransferase
MTLRLPIETKRLTLRPFERSDLDAVMAYYARPDAQRYVDWKIRDRLDGKQALDAMRKQIALNRPGDALTLAIVRQRDHQVLGHVSLRWADATAAQGELRLILNPACRKQGYAKEVAKAILELGFDHFRFHRIFARCDARSPAPAALLKGIGMRLEAHYREHALFQGEWDEELHFAILDREWTRGGKVHELLKHRVA